ncbi:MAG TPA: tetratricopeptide repeat protein [Longimicrobiaceae bacterium]|nr:tetratricopeptide repeat protein [Longimicrobiaceae bacterium]
MTADPIENFRTRFESIRTDIEAAERSGPGHDPSRLRDEIVVFFRDVERAVQELERLKEELRPLVDRYKAIRERGRDIATSSRRADHLGSSTFRDRGWSAIAAGDFAGARAALERALELAPGDPDAGALLGWAQMAMEDYDDALATLQTVLLRVPDHDLARVNLGYVCLRKGIYGEAIEHLSRVMRAGRDRKAVLYAHLYLGRVYLDREMLDDARGFFEKAIELGPNLIEAYWELGRARYLDDDEEGAVEIWRSGIEANRFSPWGERCQQAIRQVEEGEAVTFG